MRVPAAFVALPLVCGAAAGALAAGPDAAAPRVAAWCALLALSAACASFLERDAAGVALAVVVGSASAGLSLGLTATAAAYQPPLIGWFDAAAAHRDLAPVVLEGVLREDGALADYGGTLALDVRAIVSRDAKGTEITTVTRGGVRLTVGGASAPAHLDAWRAGRTVRAAASLRLPTSYRNPGAGDERKGLARRGVVLVGTVKSAALVEVTRCGGPIDEAAAAARHWTRAVLARRVGVHLARSAGVANAILIGDRSALPEDDERRLQEAGTYHVIAISGGNIAILTAILLGGLRLLRVPPRVASAIAILALLFYAELTGAPASVGRAVTAAVLYLAGRMLDHQGAPMNALAVAAAVAVAWSPVAALDAGFILSFGATAGILLGTPHLLRWPGRRARSRAARLARAALLAPAALMAASACAEIVLAPVSASLFSRVTIAGLILNLAAIPLMGLVQGASLATLGAELFSGSAADACGRIVHLASVGLVDSSRLLELTPWLSRAVGPPAWTLVTIYYAAWLAALLMRGRRAWAMAVGAAAGLAVAIAPSGWTRGAVPSAARDVLRIAILDVGQGDATAVVLPNGRALLVDAGGLPGSSFDMGERVVAPALRALGVRRLEELVITHADPDHLGGALSIVRQFRPRVVREGVPVPPHEGLRALESAAARTGASWRVTQAGDVDRFGVVTVRVHHPPPPEWERQRVRNDDSVVLELRLGDVSIVLPGDIGEQPERVLVPQLDLAPLVILKAGHHGSATSSTKAFIDALRPAAAIVSAGANNRFGHPAPSVVRRLRSAGAVIFQTHEDGAVIVETDGRRVEVRGWTGRRVVLGRQPRSR